MSRQSSTPGPEIGWAFGGLGFVVTILVGSLLGTGIGFVFLSLVLWVGLGGLFAFLVERSLIEEHDRVEELQNTRLATLQPAPVERGDGPRAASGGPKASSRSTERSAIDGPSRDEDREGGIDAPEGRTERTVTGYRREAPPEAEPGPAAA